MGFWGFGIANDNAADLSFVKTAPDEATASQDFDDYVSSGGVVSRDSGKDAVEHAMERSWWDFATKLVRVADETFDIDLSSAVHQTGKPAAYLFLRDLPLFLCTVLTCTACGRWSHTVPSSGFVGRLAQDGPGRCWNTTSV